MACQKPLPCGLGLKCQRHKKHYHLDLICKVCYLFVLALVICTMNLNKAILVSTKIPLTYYKNILKCISYLNKERSKTYPNDELDFGTSWSASEILKSSGDVHSADFVVVVSLGGILSDEVVEDTVELSLLNSLDLNGLEDLSWTCL